MITYSKKLKLKVYYVTSGIESFKLKQFDAEIQASPTEGFLRAWGQHWDTGKGLGYKLYSVHCSKGSTGKQERAESTNCTLKSGQHWDTGKGRAYKLYTEEWAALGHWKGKRVQTVHISGDSTGTQERTDSTNCTLK